MIAELVLPVVGGLLAVAALTLVRDLGPGVPAGRRAVAVAVWGVAASAILLIPAVQAALGQGSGVANLGEPLARSCLMVAGTGAQAIFRLASPVSDAARAVRARVVALVVALSGFWACFLAAPAEPASGDIYLSYPQVPAIMAMLVIMLAFLTWTFADLLTGWVRLASRTRGPVRRGLGLMAWGAGAGMAWVLVRVAGPAAELAGHDRWARRRRRRARCWLR